MNHQSLFNHALALVAAEPPPTSWLRRTLGPVLKNCFAPLDRWLGSLSMATAVICTVGLFVITGIWVWTLQREYIYLGAPDRARWRDLRIWATLVLLPYIAVYLILGR